MAKKFMDEQSLINSHVTSYVDRITDFSKYIEGSPTFTTYFNKDLLASSSDMGLKGVHEIVGMESPIRYNKINNFPIYKVTEFDIDIDTDDENGTSTRISGEAVILPDCGITPMIDDCFLIKYDKRELTFRIIDVQISSISDKVLYKITYEYDKWDLSILEQHQISKEYETRFDNIGNKNVDGQVIIEKSIQSYIDELKDCFANLRQKYVDIFYNSDLNTFILRDDYESYIYDNNLMYFIKNNNLFIEKKTFLKNIYIEPLHSFHSEDYKRYKETFYYDIENSIALDYSDNPLFMDIIPVDIPHSIFSVFKNKYGTCKRIFYYKEKVEGFIETEVELDYIVRRYFLYLLGCQGDHKYTQEENEQELKDLKDDILDYEFEFDTVECYISVPIILFIIKKLIEILEKLN